MNEHRSGLKLGNAGSAVHERFTKRMGRLVSCIAFTLAACSGGGEWARTQTTPDFSRSSGQEQVSGQTVTAAEIYVGGTRGSDVNSGTRDHPVKTISKAIRMARANNSRNIPTRVLVNPGVYRDAAVWVAGSRETEAPITIMASKGGTVTISGSDVWSNWQPDERNLRVLTHRWPYKWGLCSVPRGWPSVQDIARRKEMIFVNGDLMTQVLSLADMKENSFFVDELNAQVHIWVPAETNVQTATIEVAVRPELLRFQGQSNLALRGLKFVHANSCFSKAAVAIFGGSNNRVEDSEFTWNNWTGFSAGASLNFAVRRVIANNNGGPGLEGYVLNDTVFENVELSQRSYK